MSADAGSESQMETLIKLARSYADGEPDAGMQLIAAVDEETIQLLPHELRAVIIDAILSGKKTSFDERSTKLLRSALNATVDEGFLVKKANAYFAAGEQMAAETLLEWRVLLAARKQAGSAIHVEALIDLCEVYQSGGKRDKAREIRDVAASACASANQKGAGKLLAKVAQSCYDALDLRQAEAILKRAVSALEAETGGKDDALVGQSSADLIDCLRLLHAVAEREERVDDALSIARRIQRLLGEKDGIDEIDRLLATYANLPDYFDLAVRPDGVDLCTDDFPKIVQEFSALDLAKYFVDAFSQTPGLTPQERDKVAADLFHIMRTVTKIVTGPAGATLTRSQETSIDLPRGLSDGYVQKITFGTTVTFRLVPNPPDEATFVNVTGITFSAGGKLIGMQELSLKGEDKFCLVKPMLAECGNVKQTASSTLQSLSNFTRDMLVGFFLKTTTFSINLPCVLDDYRRYLDDATNLKRALQYQEKDLLSFFERCARIEVSDPLTRALFQNGVRICRKIESIQIDRQTVSSCDLGGVTLTLAATINLNMRKTQAELDIPDIQGVDLRVGFNAPSELGAIGLDLRRSIPSRIESIKLSLPKDRLRRIVVGTAPGRWIGLDLDEATMRPAFDQNQNWMLFGFTSNPISGAAQSFYLRLDRHNELKMTTRELACLVSQTAMEGFSAEDPLTWKWGVIAVGAETVLTTGTILRSTIGDEATDKIAEEVQAVARFFKRLLF